MTLLQEIQQLAVDSRVDLDSVLRKCLILSSRLKHAKLKVWIRSELNGYGSNDLPTYRTFRSFAQGHFSGPFRTLMKNANISETHIPKEFRDILQIWVTHSISEIQDMINDATEGRLMNPWPASLYPLFDGTVFENMTMVNAWTVIPKNKLVGVLNAVRNRVLNFVLEMEEEYPKAGEASDNDPRIPAERVNQIFNTNVYGSVSNFSAGSSVFTMSAVVVESGNFTSLSEYLAKIGIDEELITELRTALDRDPEPSGSSFGENVSTWLGKVMKLGAQGALKIATSSIGTPLTAALMQYYGIPSPS